jgi:arginine decarboxylase
MFGPLPTEFFLTAGAGEASTELNAFDAALLQAGIGDTNLIKLSSILPPSAQETGLRSFPKGFMIPVAYGDLTCPDTGAVISASIAVGIPKDPSMPGLIMECARIGEPEPCERSVRAMVREGMEDIRGLAIREIKSTSVSHRVVKVGAVVAAVVLCP